MHFSGQNQNDPTAQAIEIAIRLGLIFLILAWCLHILSPFVSLIAWGGIIAVSIYPLFIKLIDKLGGKRKLAVTLVALIGIAVILIPVISLSGSLIEGASNVGDKISSGTLHISPPSESVREWPLIGEKTYAFWMQASENLTGLIEKYPDQIAAVGKKLLGMAAGAGAGVLQFIVSLIIAAAFLAGADSASAALQKLARRLSGEHGEDLLLMSANTVRSVAVGVIGIAFIQALLAGIGMLIAGVPAAGLLAIIAFVLGIAQLPPLLVLLPVLIYLFSGDSMGIAIFFLVWTVIVAASDLVLKPLLLGRGVDAPMMVILLGAIGGMIVSGIVGLFIGAVVLAVGYKLFQAWVEKDNPAAQAAAEYQP
jgi:predicted PurR-regulated permease PerM